MKKQLLFTLVLAMVANLSFASFEQGNWRWRNNDGNETTATWRAAQNTSAEVSSKNEIIRLRIEIGVSASSNASSWSTSLQYSTDQSTWVSLQTPNAVSEDEKPFAIVSTNSFLGANEATTRQLTSTHFSNMISLPGSVVYNSNTIYYNISPTDAQTYEYEIVLTSTEKLEAGKTYYFKMANGTYTLALPSLTTPATLPISLNSLNAKSLANGIQINWNTASETNNKYFNLERSSNGLNWESIAKIDGNGTTNTQSNYSFTDKNPIDGINYYRLAQHDADGKINYSGVTSAKFDFGSTAFNVYPNPFVDQLSVNLPGYNGKAFEARLSNTQGQTVFQKQLVADENGINIHLNQSQKPGVYVLSVIGNGINLVKKVSVK